MSRGEAGGHAGAERGEQFGGGPAGGAQLARGGDGAGHVQRRAAHRRDGARGAGRPGGGAFDGGWGVAGVGAEVAAIAVERDAAAAVVRALAEMPGGAGP